MKKISPYQKCYEHKYVHDIYREVLWNHISDVLSILHRQMQSEAPKVVLDSLNLIIFFILGLSYFFKFMIQFD